MAKHEFGILPAGQPKHGQRFDGYEPALYGCISIDDELIEPLLQAFMAFPTYSHTVDIPSQGLVYCGVTLIPPESLKQFSTILDAQKNPGYSTLLSLIACARGKKRYLIHYGL